MGGQAIQALFRFAARATPLTQVIGVLQGQSNRDVLHVVCVLCGLRRVATAAVAWQQQRTAAVLSGLETSSCR